MGSGFSRWVHHQCSLLALIAHSSPQNLLTCHLIYQVVAGDYRMNGRFGHATVQRNLPSGPWLDQGVVDNEPALPRHRAGIGPHPVFHFCNGQMGGCMGHSCHVFFSSRFTRSKGLENVQRAQRCCAVFASRVRKRLHAPVGKARATHRRSTFDRHENLVSEAALAVMLTRSSTPVSLEETIRPDHRQLFGGRRLSHPGLAALLERPTFRQIQ
jgi:hypothetical protein